MFFDGSRAELAVWYKSGNVSHQSWKIDGTWINFPLHFPHHYYTVESKSHHQERNIPRFIGYSLLSITAKRKISVFLTHPKTIIYV